MLLGTKVTNMASRVKGPLAGCATANSSSNDRSLSARNWPLERLIKRPRSNFAVDRFYNSTLCTSIARMTFFEFHIGRFLN